MPDREDKMSAMITISIASQMAVSMDEATLSDIINDATRFHTLVPILDPTAYIRGADNVQVNEAMVRAYSTFRVACIKAGVPRLGE